MSTPLARFQATRATGRITWRSVLGILLVPLVVAGVLVWAFWNPQERLDTVDAAIVNLDEPVELDGQTVPLGRQLAAGLVGGASTESSSTAAGVDLADTNYNWVLTDKEDADSGLTSGRFTAVVTIPQNFSAAATSFSGKPGDAERATIDVETSDKSRLVDDAISSVITSTAASLVGNQLTTSYLENVYVGFNTLGDELGTAADGAQELATGATSLADGAAQLASGTTEFSGGVSSFSSGVTEYTRGVSELSSGLTTLRQQTAALPAQVGQLATGATGVANGIDALVAGMGQQGAALQRLSAQCAQAVVPAEETQAFCDGLAALATGSTDPAAAAQTARLAAGARQVADGTTALAAGMPALASGIDSAASGAAQLASSGTTVNSGALELATGAASLATGAAGVSEGAAGVATGVDSLASGLGEATDAIPSYTESERETLADVVATPVVAEGTGGLSFGTAGVPFFAALALWLGAFASFLVLLAVPRRVLGSTRPSTVLALKAWMPGAVVGVVQGVLVAGILQPLMKLDLADWFSFAAVAALTGIAFASTNQALNAVFGGAGRFISMVVALVLIGTSIIATAPAALDSTVEFLPLQPGLNAFQSIVTGGGGLVPAIVGLVLWTLGALAATTLAVAQSRSVSVRQLVPHTP
jgi:putative membrane protein